MANINAIIAQGGNVPQIRNINRRNALLDLAIQNEPVRQERLQSQENRLQSQSDINSEEAQRKQATMSLVMVRGLLAAGFDDSALEVARKAGTPGSQELVAALESGDPAQREAAVGQVEQLYKSIIEKNAEQKTPAAIQTFDSLIGKINDPDVSATEKEAALINLGINPRAKGPQVVDVGDVPFLWNPQTKQLSSFGSDGKPVTPETVASNKATIASTVKGAEQAVVQSGKIFELLGPVNKSIVNINDAINAIDQGADTGAIMGRLPSVTEASVTLDNIRGQMGLDIIGATTFGALSEGELEFALSTALPIGLDEPALRNWLVRKGEAQKKYSEELRKAAIYLGKPGNTVSGYLDSLEVNGLFSRSDNAPEFPIGTVTDSGKFIMTAEGWKPNE